MVRLIYLFLVLTYTATIGHSQYSTIDSIFENALTEYYDNSNKELGYQLVDSLAKNCINSESKSDICLKCIYYNGFFKKKFGLYQDAISTYTKAIELDTTNTYLLKCNGEISTVYAKLNDYAQARDYALKAYNNPDVTLKLKYRLPEELAKYCLNMRDSTILRESISWIDTALHYRTLAGKGSPLNTVQRESDRGLAYIKLGDYVQAEAIYNTALQTLNECCEQPITEYKIYNNLGNIFTLKGESKTALKYYRKCMNIYESYDIKPSQQSLGKLFRNIASSYLQQGKFKDATNTLEKGIAVSSVIIPGNEEGTDIFWENLKNKMLLSSIEYHEYQINGSKNILDNCITNGMEAIETIKYLKWNLTHDDSKVLWSEETKGHIDMIIEAHLLDGDEGKAIQLIEESKYMTLNEKLYTQVAKLENEKYNDAFQNIIEPAFSKNEKLQETLSQLAGKQDENYSKYRTNVEYTTYQTKNNNITLSFWESNDKYYRIQYNERRPQIDIIENKSEIDSLISQYHQAISSRSNYFDICKKLHSYLLPETLTSDQLIIIPHGLLNTVSFAALLNKNEKFLIENHSISYLKSTLIDKPKYINDSEDILVVQPDLSKNISLDLLPGAIKECNYIAQHYDSNLLKSGNAKSSNIVKKLKDPINILHIASHSSIDKSNPMGSHIYLSDSTVLSVDDIYKSKMKSNLVVLSMCESAQGQLKTAEGIRGLSYAFDLTGNHNQILTMWNIDDQNSSEIISKLYDQLHQNIPIDKALQSSQLSHLASAPNILRHPHYWAGYIYQGSDQTVKVKRKSTTWLMIGLLGLCALVLTFGIRIIKSK